jgi:PhoPQ-activated pathogenicity-related protein
MKYKIGTIILALSIFGCTTPDRTPETDQTPSFPLKEYVVQGDDAFSYEVKETIQGEGWTEYRIKMTSGHWLTEKEVDQTLWWHWISMVVPEKLEQTGSMMIIGGGSWRDSIPRPAEEWQREAALATHTIVSYVSNIPFQPIDYVGDPKDQRWEDDLIAYGWRQYLESGASDEYLEWLARFPMTRAVVRAMDVVEEISATFDTPVEEFFVAGASKRGWTTWTTAAVDERVVGMAPIVIDLLNIIPSFEHHWQCYGEWSPAVQNYVEEGIMNWMHKEEFAQLLKIVEPYSFVERLKIPKLLINATCDEFFVTDSWQFYWDDLQGESYLQYVPNGNHGLRGTYQPVSLISFYNATITNTPIPDFEWSIDGNSILMEVDPASLYQIRKWEVTNPTARDFRIYVIGENAWEMEEVDKQEDGRYEIAISSPEEGFKAALVELVFNPGSNFPLTFTSGTLVTPDQYPHEPFVPAQ